MAFDLVVCDIGCRTETAVKAEVYFQVACLDGFLAWIAAEEYLLTFLRWRGQAPADPRMTCLPISAISPSVTRKVAISML